LDQLKTTNVLSHATPLILTCVQKIYIWAVGCELKLASKINNSMNNVKGLKILDQSTDYRIGAKLRAFQYNCSNTCLTITVVNVKPRHNTTWVPVQFQTRSRHKWLQTK